MFSGTVVHGEAKGRKLGFPTANLDTPINKTRLRDGVYATIVTLRDQKYIGALAIKKEKAKVEVYLVGYNGEDFYGETISVDPLAIVSGYEHYSTQDELRVKITSDVELVKATCKEFGYSKDNL